MNQTLIWFTLKPSRLQTSVPSPMGSALSQDICIAQALKTKPRFPRRSRPMKKISEILMHFSESITVPRGLFLVWISVN
jgi:hypothetical protein